MRVEGIRQVCGALVCSVNLVPLWNEIDMMAQCQRGAYFGQSASFLGPTPPVTIPLLLFNTSIGFVTFRRIGPLVVHGCAIPNGSAAATEPHGKLRVSQPATVWLTAPKSLCQSLCQRPPRRPVLPAFPTSKAFAVNNLHFPSFHGMEEVIGSIPIRSTNHFNNLASVIREH